MNKWTQYSIEYANQRSYLDDLFAETYRNYNITSALVLRNYLYQI
ncbi:MAG: hypothetical protein LBR36_05560 [Bacteroidales bacterium]|nr:hypothetical protein [Bacteroidales bacterium]